MSIICVFPKEKPIGEVLVRVYYNELNRIVALTVNDERGVYYYYGNFSSDLRGSYLVTRKNTTWNKLLFLMIFQIILDQ